MKTITICASGPSLTTNDVSLAKAHSDEIIAVNDTWRMGLFDHLYAADAHWWHYHIHDINCGFSGKRWSCDPPKNTNWCRHDPIEWNVHVFDCKIAEEGLSTDARSVVSGGNSGYQAINLAYHLGATRIILLGYDLCWNSGKSHWFGDHPEGLNNSKPDRYIPAFRTIKPEDYGLEILNCTRHTALDAFPCVPLEEVCGV